MIESRIHKRYPAAHDSAAFRLDVEFAAGPGITVLFGPSGAGKSLVLDCIAGFAEPDAGRILIDDAIVFDSGARVSLPPQQRRCGYVFQNYALFPHMTLRENLMFAAAGLPKLERTRKCVEMLGRFRLTDAAGRKPQEVSGGQKQRCSIARALIAAPRVLLLDEPAQGLDAPLRADFHEVLRDVRSEYDTPVILVTHSIEESLTVGDRMIVLHEGRLVQQGTPAEVCGHPSNLAIADLLGAFNIFSVEIISLDPSRNTGVLRLGEYDLQSEYYKGHLKGDRVQLLAAPRQLRARPRVGRLEANQIPTQLHRVVDMGTHLRLEFERGYKVEIDRGPVDRNNGEWVIEFPTRGLRVL
jgi:molybdate transport system ATP-binding protein